MTAQYIVQFRSLTGKSIPKIGHFIKGILTSPPLSSRWPTVSTSAWSLCSLTTWSSASGSDKSLRHPESCSSAWRRRGLFWPEWFDPQGLSVFLHIPQHTSVINCTKHAKLLQGESRGMGGVILSHKVKQQRHHLFTGLRSFSRGSGLQRNDSVWKAANRSSRPSRPSSTCPVRAEWRVWSWGCLTGKQCHYLLTLLHSCQNRAGTLFWSSSTDVYSDAQMNSLLGTQELLRLQPKMCQRFSQSSGISISAGSSAPFLNFKIWRPVLGSNSSYSILWTVFLSGIFLSSIHVPVLWSVSDLVSFLIGCQDSVH